MPSRTVRFGGNFVQASPKARVAGAWVQAKQEWARVSDTWVKMWEDYVLPVLNPAYNFAEGFNPTIGGTQISETEPVYVSLVGGEAPFTWSFDRVSGDTVTSAGFNTAARSGTFQPTVFTGDGTYSGKVRATVTDARGNVATADCDWTITKGILD